ncbi:hypothetical protein [Streptomyces sp. H27-C3]|uniref:hypothetical protein n=1 Tax=Streptomyces sp. H27-C3 TaxID=3046305 RepID=UPI0024BA477C|nr:hypothetical protein [Streptomyces sp. H27-C3]MDJ0466460.1 hypothetical protein [Streptomyces sp. H27-C3]
MSAGDHGDQHNGSGPVWPPPPPPPSHPPTVGPPVPPDPARATAVGLLNLTGLGLGYVLLRQWIRAVVCWVATGALVLIALPAEPDGVPGGLLVAYLLVLVLAAADGARRALRSRTALPVRPAIAVVLGLLLLAVPAGGAVAYGSAQDEAREQVLLDRLGDADRAVRTAANQSFASGEQGFKTALADYRELEADHPDSRAAKLVPERLDAYYKAVATPYSNGQHCLAIDALKYLRTVPGSVDKRLLGDLATWPDQPLATSYYECGMSKLGEETSGAEAGPLGELLRTFPESKQAAKVEPAVRARIKDRAGAMNDDGPCEVTEELRRIGATASALPGSTGAALRTADDRPVENGLYACGVKHFKDKEFSEARKTLETFAGEYRQSGKSKQARNIAIAAEIAETRAAAGNRLPPEGSPGGARMPFVITNDGPDAVEVLYTGPTTGTIKVGACKGCTTYTSTAVGKSQACKGSSGKYPKATLQLPAGNYHFLHKNAGKADANISNNASGPKIQPGYSYTYCTFVVRGLGLPGLPDLTKPLPAPTIPLPDLAKPTGW